MNDRLSPIERELFGDSAGTLERLEAAIPRRLNADPEGLEKGLAHLVLARSWR
jgi:hypothetical protein